MKRVIYILACVICFLISLLLLAVCLNSGAPYLNSLSNYCRLTGRNLLNNSDFSNGLNDWKYNKSITVLTTNSVNYVCIQGDPQKQVRLSQSVNVVSGQTYRLIFNLNTQSDGAFAIFSDDNLGKEIFFRCDGKSKQYSFNFIPRSTGNSQIFLSTKAKGIFYYSNVELRKINKNLRFFYIFIIILFFLLLVRSNLFFFIFILLLSIIPILKITKLKKSESENRTLAEYKPLFSKEYRLNKNFGFDFNNWINDHFWIRKDLMRNQNTLKYLVDGKADNKFVFQGKDKWLFLKSNIRRIAKPDSYYEGIYDDTAKAIKRFNDFCIKNNAKLYIVLAPFGEEVYSEEIPNLNLLNRVGRLGKYTAKLQIDCGATIIYTLDSLLNAKIKALTQYKTDHHWTQFGAWNAYNELRTKIFNDLNITQAYNTPFELKEHKLNIGHTETFNRVKNIADSFAIKIYPDDAVYLKFITNKDFICDDNGSRLFNKNGSDLKVFLFGDSYTKNIKGFFGYDFRNTKFFVKPLQIYMPKFEKEISAYKPNIVVMIIYSQNYDLIQNWYNK